MPDNADTAAQLDEEIFTEELGWYSYTQLVQRVVELEAALEAATEVQLNDGPAD